MAVIDRFKRINEAFSMTRTAKGDVEHSSSTLDDAHIKKALAHISDPSIAKEIDKIFHKVQVPGGVQTVEEHLPSGFTLDMVLEAVAKRLEMVGEKLKVSPLLYTEIAQNAVEDCVFSTLNTHQEHLDKKYGKNRKRIVSSAPIFDNRVFNKLVSMIKSDHATSLFPLKNQFEPTPVRNVDVILVPSYNRAYKEFNDVKTAAATQKGQFIFNVPFMQSLIDWAHLKEVKPQQSKYACNGGPIPDEYCYIEFVILHEFLHFTLGHFHLFKEIKKFNHTIGNWAGDFEINYLLKKSGYYQLPMGLFNDAINHDRQNGFAEIYRVVKEEFDKFPKDEKPDEKTDDHSKGNDEGEKGDAGEQGESGGGGGGDPQDGEDGDDEQNGEGEGSGEKEGDDENKKKGKGSGEGEEGEDGEKDDKNDGKPGKSGNSSEKSEEDIINQHDKNFEELAEKFNKDAKEAQTNKGKAGETSGDMGKMSSSRTGNFSHKRASDKLPGKFNALNERPTFSWKQILENMISHDVGGYVDTYSRPARSSITQAGVLRQVGAAAIKPAEIPLHAQKKICFVVDSSGSMGNCIPKIFNEIEHLIAANPGVADEFFLIKFSNDHHIFKCSIANGGYTKLASLSDPKQMQQNLGTGSIKALFAEHYGAGTSFSGTLVDDINSLLEGGFNIVVMSDLDITDGTNLVNVKKFCAPQWTNRIYFILDSRNTWIRMVEVLNGTPASVTYFDK